MALADRFRFNSEHFAQIRIHRMPKRYQGSRPNRPAEMHKLVSSIQSIKKRNLLRGYIHKSVLTSEDIEAIRRSNSVHDSMVAGAILKGRYGLIDNPGQIRQRNRTSADLYTMVRFPPIDWRNEVSYSAGFINSVKQRALSVLETMRALGRVDSVNPDDSLQALLDLAKAHGASNFLSYKLAYIRSAFDLSPEQIAIVGQIEREIQHRGSPGLHFSALENLSSQVSIFVVAKRRIGGLTDRVQGDFRRSITLSNFIPTPLDYADVASFLLRASESSLVDMLYATITIFNLHAEFESVQREFENRLDAEIISELRQVIYHAAKGDGEDVVTDFYRSHNEDEYQSLNNYRISAAFLERPKCAAYRSRLDRVIGVRLLSEVLDERQITVDIPAQTLKALMLSPSGILIPGETLRIKLDPFYRTYLFLSYLRNRSNILALDQAEVKGIFENTTGLDALLSESEMRALYLTAPMDSRGLVTVLALALYRKKSVDPDVDFEFRSDFISHVQNNHNGSILDFIAHLLEDSPAIAHYIASSLDEVTLQKMYTIVSDASAASKIRIDILRAVGQKLNRIEFFVEADAISTRSKVSKLQQYFDSSRIYVDGVAMQKWLDTNPTIATEQYRAITRRTSTKIAAGDSTSDQIAKALRQLGDEEYLVQQIVKDAFEQFCLNNEFGIQSYLGRRIRHNTLQGVMIETVDAVLSRPANQAIASSAGIRNSIQVWLASYNAMLEKLRKEQLQFKSAHSLFNATLDFTEPTTAENVRQLAAALRLSAGADLLNDLVISFCWKQIAPQLESASRYIKTTLLNEANASIEHHFSRFVGPFAENRLKLELHEAMNEVFKKVASWFQVPQTGFIATSIRDLVHIIVIDLKKPPNQVEFVGNAPDLKFTGISVHRIYDCLAVLLQNAHKHGEEDSQVIVEATSDSGLLGAALSRVTVRVTQSVAAEAYDHSKDRIRQAIESKESGSDMVTEGYTGIKKIKFITSATEGLQTISWSAEDSSRRITMGFSLHAENAIDEVKAS